MEDEFSSFSLHHQDVSSDISDAPHTHLVKASRVMQTQELIYESSGNIQKDNVSAYQS